MSGQKCTPCYRESTTYYVGFEGDEEINVTLDTFVEQPPSYIYRAGNGIKIENKVISIDDLIIDCGTSTTVLFGGES